MQTATNQKAYEREGNISFHELTGAGQGITSKPISAQETNVCVFSFILSNRKINEKTQNVCTITTCEVGKIRVRDLAGIVTGDARLSKKPSAKNLLTLEDVITDYLATNYSIGIAQFEVNILPC